MFKISVSKQMQQGFHAIPYELVNIVGADQNPKIIFQQNSQLFMEHKIE